MRGDEREMRGFSNTIRSHNLAGGDQPPGCGNDVSQKDNQRQLKHREG